MTKKEHLLKVLPKIEYDLPLKDLNLILEAMQAHTDEQLILSGVRKWQFLATTIPEQKDKYYTVLDKYGNVEEKVLFGCSGFMNEPYSFFEGRKIASKDLIAFC